MGARINSSRETSILYLLKIEEPIYQMLIAVLIPVNKINGYYFFYNEYLKFTGAIPKGLYEFGGKA
jgi:hypothetical protein